MKPGRWFSNFLLVAALVLGQAGAALHAFSHFREQPAPEPKQHFSGERVCDQCVAYAHLSGAAPAAAAWIFPDQLPEVASPLAAAWVSGRTILSPPARGPPFFL